MNFWDEIQKQYQNSEQRYRDAINTGVSMLTNKFNIMNTIYNNDQNMIGTLLGIEQNKNNQNLGMFGYLLGKEQSDRAFNESKRQFNVSQAFEEKTLNYNIEHNADMLDLQRQKLELDKKLQDKQITLSEYDRKQENIANSAILLDWLNKFPTSQSDIETYRGIGADPSTLLKIIQNKATSGSYGNTKKENIFGAFLKDFGNSIRKAGGY